MAVQKTVCIESPYAGDTVRNLEYARACLTYCLDQGVAPFASHLLYPQVYDDSSEHHREIGLQAANRIGRQCDEVWVFTDHGISSGMQRAIDEATEANQPVHYRRLPTAYLPRALDGKIPEAGANKIEEDTNE